MTSDLTDIFIRSGLTRAIVNPARVRRDRLFDRTFTAGGLRPDAIGAAVPLAVALTIPGVSTTGAAVAVPQFIGPAAVIDRFLAYAKTPPSGGEFTGDITVNGATIGSVTIQPGISEGITTNVNAATPPNAVTNVNVTAANGAADITISVVYRPS